MNGLGPLEFATPAPGSLRAWLLAIRLKTLTAAFSPVLLGTVVASRKADLDPEGVALTFLGAALLQILSNLANDVFDYENGADTADRLGPKRAVQAGLVSPGAMKIAMGVVIILGLLLGARLISLSGPAILVIGLCSLISAIAYTGGPYPLGYHGLGDLFVFIFFGLVATAGTAWVHLGQLDTAALLLGAGVGLLSVNILVVNNLRDRFTDVRAGKRTLAVRFGRRFAELQYLGGLASSALVLPLLILLENYPWTCLAGCLVLPLGWSLYRSLQKLEGKDLNALLGKSAGVVLLYSVLVASGVTVASWVLS